MSVYLGIPTYNNHILEGHLGAILKASKKELVGKLEIKGYSALTYNFNSLFANALNERKKGCTHFAMIHADILPEDFWLDTLMAKLEEFQADMISAIVPIKYNKGITSTALDESLEGSNPYWRPRRLTLHECFEKYPPTFTDEKLLLNTGCMLIDIRKPWVEKIRFRFDDAIVKKQNGEFQAIFAPEDWLFSRDARNLGAKLLATREVKVEHHGVTKYTNDRAWGSHREDSLSA